VSIAKVSLILLAPLGIIGIIIVGVISGQATRRNENRLESEETDETRPGERGPGGVQGSGLLPSVVAARCGLSSALSTFRPSACTFGMALRAFRHAPFGRFRHASFGRFRLSGWCPDPLAPANAWPF
jgi:hypothetical protein